MPGPWHRCPRIPISPCSSSSSISVPRCNGGSGLELRWLPARLSALESPEIQATTPVAAVLREQADAPFDSFVTLNYMAVTLAIGREIQKALRGEQTASQALTVAEDAVRPLLG